MTEAMPFLQKYDITFLRPPTIRPGRFLAGMAGFGPTNAGVKVLCLTAWRHPIIITVIFYHIGGFVSSAKPNYFPFAVPLARRKGNA